MTVVYFLIFLFGLIVGSFLNCVIYRLAASERGEPRPDGSGREKWNSFLSGRSYCPNCKKTLSWQDLIPLFSFFILRGKCRYCQKSISWQYPLVELLTGFLFVLIFWHFNFGFDLLFGFLFLDFLYLLIIFCLLIIIFVYDLKHYIIPDSALFSAVAVAFIYNILYSLFIIHNSQFLIQSLFSASGASLFFLTIFLVSRGNWLGFGDVKLAFFMGLFLGFPNILVALFLAFFIGAIIGLGLMIFGKKGLKSEVPFGPFLITGTFIALFWGQNLIRWYVNYLNI